MLHILLSKKNIKKAVVQPFLIVKVFTAIKIYTQKNIYT